MFSKGWKATLLQGWLILLEITCTTEPNENKDFCHQYQKDHMNEARRKEPLSGVGMPTLKEPRLALLRYRRDEVLHGTVHSA